MTLGSITSDRMGFTLACGCAGHTVFGIEDRVLQRASAGRVGHALEGIAIELSFRQPGCKVHNTTPPSRYFMMPADTDVVPG